MEPITVLIAEDHTLVREGTRQVLEQEPDLRVVGEAESGDRAVALARSLLPNVVLLDVRLPVLNGIDAARRLRKILPSARLIFVTMHAGADYVGEAFRAGAMGYILKRAAASELLTAIHAVLKGNHYVSPLVTRNALDLLISSSKPGGKFQDRLTPRQREVLQLVAEGRSRKEIARILNITVKTVEFHKGKLMHELNLQTVADFTRYAIEHGIIPAERSS